jgi:hypothetical protein
MKIFAMLCVALVLTACAGDAIRPESPIDVVGTVTNPRGTGWTKDFCDGGHLVVSAPDCAQIGGEIYKVNLLDVHTSDGRRIARKLVIGFPAHAITRKYHGTKRLRLERSQEDFRKATGIELVATDWSDA